MVTRNCNPGFRPNPGVVKGEPNLKIVPIFKLGSPIRQYILRDPTFLSRSNCFFVRRVRLSTSSIASAAHLPCGNDQPSPMLILVCYTHILIRICNAFSRWERVSVQRYMRACDLCDKSRTYVIFEERFAELSVTTTTRTVRVTLHVRTRSMRQKSFLHARTRSMRQKSHAHNIRRTDRRTANALART